MMDKKMMITGKFVIGHDGTDHVIYEDGVVVYQGNEVIYVGHDHSIKVDEVWDTGLSIISPGFIDLEADIDTDHALIDVVLFKKHPNELTDFEMVYSDKKEDSYTEEMFRIRQQYSMAQLIMNGITTAMPIEGEQFHAWGQTYREMEIMAENAKNLNLRMYLGPTFCSRKNREQPFDSKRGQKSFQDAVAFYEDFHDTQGGLIKGFMNPCQIAMTEPELLLAAKDFSVKHGCPMRLHACEENIEWEYMLKTYHMTTIDYFHSIGLLTPQLMIPHCITVKDSELIKLAENHVTVITTPVAEVNYGSGLYSFAKYQDKKINIAMGTDCQPVDMIQNMRLAWNLDRICEWQMLFCKYQEDGSIRNLFSHEKDYPKTTGADFFRCATTNGAKALGRSDIGRLAKGTKADIIVIDLDDLSVGPYEDPIRTMLISCVGNHVKHTIVDGKIVMKDRKVCGLDETKLRQKAQKVYEAYLGFFQEHDKMERPLDTLFPPSFPIKRKQKI